jgi:hypothetical protein
VLTEADGVPLVVQTTPANVNDETQLPALLDAMPAVQGPRGRPRRKPGSIFGDRGLRHRRDDRAGDDAGHLQLPGAPKQRHPR